MTFELLRIIEPAGCASTCMPQIQRECYGMLTTECAGTCRLPSVVPHCCPAGGLPHDVIEPGMLPAGIPTRAVQRTLAIHDGSKPWPLKLKALGQIT